MLPGRAPCPPWPAQNTGGANAKVDGPVSGLRHEAARARRGQEGPESGLCGCVLCPVTGRKAQLPGEARAHARCSRCSEPPACRCPARQEPAVCYPPALQARAASRPVCASLRPGTHATRGAGAGSLGRVAQLPTKGFSGVSLCSCSACRMACRRANMRPGTHALRKRGQVLWQMCSLRLAPSHLQKGPRLGGRERAIVAGEERPSIGHKPITKYNRN
jgi:hypothetical protein